MKAGDKNVREACWYRIAQTPEEADRSVTYKVDHESCFQDSAYICVGLNSVEECVLIRKGLYPSYVQPELLSEPGYLRRTFG